MFHLGLFLTHPKDSDGKGREDKEIHHFYIFHPFQDIKIHFLLIKSIVTTDKCGKYLDSIPTTTSHPIDSIVDLIDHYFVNKQLLATIKIS